MLSMELSLLCSTKRTHRFVKTLQNVHKLHESYPNFQKTTFSLRAECGCISADQHRQRSDFQTTGIRQKSVHWCALFARGQPADATNHVLEISSPYSGLLQEAAQAG